ncbi:type II toxin-antitoxin system VapC family toxin [Aeromicrobium sp.]|uniref:type II toxin-antitoxin system VapC family toxin n=1 Tax=Aeromicrobium sp. TaxID=1871063 RepID=UPI0039E565EF
MNVFDASALLAFLQGEPGADSVEGALERGGVCSAANWSEVAQKIVARGRRWDLARSLLLSFDLRIEPVTVEDAEGAARRWSAQRHLSLGDRLCLALGDRLSGVVWTADAAWGQAERVRQIR